MVVNLERASGFERVRAVKSSILFAMSLLRRSLDGRVNSGGPLIIDTPSNGVSYCVELNWP